VLGARVAGCEPDGVVGPGHAGEREREASVLAALVTAEAIVQRRHLRVDLLGGEVAG
jgi:hypothetical protein